MHSLADSWTLPRVKTAMGPYIHALGTAMGPVFTLVREIKHFASETMCLQRFEYLRQVLDFMGMPYLRNQSLLCVLTDALTHTQTLNDNGLGPLWNP